MNTEQKNRRTKMRRQEGAGVNPLLTRRKSLPAGVSKILHKKYIRFQPDHQQADPSPSSSQAQRLSDQCPSVSPENWLEKQIFGHIFRYLETETLKVGAHNLFSQASKEVGCDAHLRTICLKELLDLDGEVAPKLYSTQNPLGL